MMSHHLNFKINFLFRRASRVFVWCILKMPGQELKKILKLGFTHDRVSRNVQTKICQIFNNDKDRQEP